MATETGLLAGQPGVPLRAEAEAHAAFNQREGFDHAVRRARASMRRPIEPTGATAWPCTELTLKGGRFIHALQHAAASTPAPAPPATGPPPRPQPPVRSTSGGNRSSFTRRNRVERVGAQEFAHIVRPHDHAQADMPDSAT